MANLAVFIELDSPLPDGDVGLTAASRLALRDARAIADAHGATVHGVVMTRSLDDVALDGLARALGEAGADRAFVCADAQLAGPPLPHRHGAMLSKVARMLTPRLFLFGQGELAARLAAPLAAEMQGAFFPRATVSCEGNALLFRRAHPGWQGIRVLDALATERPLVAMLATRTEDEIATWQGESELHLLAFEPSSGPAITDVSSREASEPAPGPPPHTVILVRDAGPETEAAWPDELPPGTAVFRSERTPLPADLLCPSTLIVIGPDTWPPPVLPASGAMVAVCSPHKPSGKWPGVTHYWKVNTDEAVLALAQALSRGERS